MASTKYAVGQIVNIGGREEVTIIDLVKRIKKKMKSKSRVEWIPYEAVYNSDFEDMARRVPALEKLKDLIGFAPSMTLDEILEKTIQDYLTQIE